MTPIDEKTYLFLIEEKQPFAVPNDIRKTYNIHSSIDVGDDFYAMARNVPPLLTRYEASAAEKRAHDVNAHGKWRYELTEEGRLLLEAAIQNNEIMDLSTLSKVRGKPVTPRGPNKATRRKTGSESNLRSRSALDVMLDLREDGEELIDTIAALCDEYLERVNSEGVKV